MIPVVCPWYFMASFDPLWLLYSKWFISRICQFFRIMALVNGFQGWNVVVQRGGSCDSVGPDSLHPPLTIPSPYQYPSPLTTPLSQKTHRIHKIHSQHSQNGSNKTFSVQHCFLIRLQLDQIVPLSHGHLSCAHLPCNPSHSLSFPNRSYTGHEAQI